jgi:hypothetical protein
MIGGKIPGCPDPRPDTFPHLVGPLKLPENNAIIECNVELPDQGLQK